MRSDPQRLLKWPRHPQQWPTRAYVLVVVLLTAGALVLALATVVRPTEFPPNQHADQWAAEAAVIGGGALFFAVVATAIATVAYINSSEKPALWIEASYPGQDKPLAMSWNNRQPDELGRVTSVGEHPDWSLSLHLHNDGPVAARFVAVRVRFGKGASLDTKGRSERWLIDQWHSSVERGRAGYPLRWEGGADVIIHPSRRGEVPWPYEAPLIGPTFLILDAPQSQTSFTFEVQVVADDVRPFSETYTIHVPLGK